MTEVVVIAVVVVVVILLVAVVVEVVGFVVIKTLVWGGAVADMLVEVLATDVPAEVLIRVVVDGVAIALGLDVSVSDSVDILSDVAVDGIGGDVLADINVNAFVVVMTVGFAMPAPSDRLSC